MNRIRCFIAIKIKPVRRYFEYISKIKQDYNIRINIVKHENYHFKLHIIDDIIHEILGSLEFQIQTRKFIPHLTVCRIRSGEEITSFTQAWLHGDFEDIVMECNKLNFIKSTLTTSGSVYSTLYEYKLN